MKIPSITVLTNGLISTLRRWPLSIALAIFTSILLMREFNDFSIPGRERHWAMIIAGYEGMLLTIAATILAERRRWGMSGKVMIQVLAVGLAVGCYFWVPVQDLQRTISFLVVTFALHWLIAFLPYAAPADGPVGFWDYNRKLFLRALQTALYTLVLWVGIWLALEAIEHLFGVEFNHAYTDTWWTLAGIFNPIFFLAGFPKEYARPERIDDYPRGLKVFTQYVLLPIVTVYLAILYAYLFKIVFTAHWPSGWVAYLVLGFSVAGILALLLIWPLLDEEGNRWIRSYSRSFYLALIPLIVLLWVAIAKRMGSYGITEERYYVVMLAAWLSGIAAYFVFSRRKDIRWIPASLCVLALLSLGGPWGASGISLSSQMGRMKKLLEKDGILVAGKIEPVRHPVPLADRKQISSVMEYITKMHDYKVLQPWFRVNLDSAVKDTRDIAGRYYWDQSRVFVRLMGFEYANEYETEDITLNGYYGLKEINPLIRTEGVDYILPHVGVNADDSIWTYYSDDAERVGIRLDSARHVLRIVTKGAPGEDTIDLRTLERAIGDSSSPPASGILPLSVMTLSNGGWKILVTSVVSLHGEHPGHIIRLEGHLMALARKKK